MTAKTARNEEIVNLRKVTGLTLRAIGVIMSLSPERVRQIVCKHDRIMRHRQERAEAAAMRAAEPMAAMIVLPVAGPVALLDTLVEDLELSIRSCNCLRNMQVTTVRELVQKTEAELMRVPNFGRKSLAELRELLALHGLYLGMST